MEPAAPRASPGSVSCRPVIPGSEGTFAPPAVPWDETVPDGLSAGGGHRRPRTGGAGAVTPESAVAVCVSV